MVPNQVEREIVIAAPIERVWAILTEPMHFRAWFAFDGAEIDLRPGGMMVMNWKEHGRFLGTVERVEPPHLFSFRGSRLPDDEPREGNATLVEFTLTPSGDGTLLRVVESGFRDLQISEDEQASAVAGNVQGWIGALSELTAYVERIAA
jgi:uncharacterized protein YndB with AHSA1/START domain